MMTKALEDIAAERQRQIESEGWTPKHDDERNDDSLAAAAACYANPFKIILSGDGLRDEQIKHMVNRFLCWKLPENFNPDGGISFVQPTMRDGQPWPHGPSGTNLLDATQARAMVEHMLEGMPSAIRKGTHRD